MNYKFINNLPKILLALGVQYLNTVYGSYGVSDSPEFAKKLRKHKLWIALNAKDELVCSRELLNCDNSWMDTLAHLKENNRDEFNRLMAL